MRAPLVTLVLSLSILPLDAHAGACPTCATTADCVEMTGQANAVCVEWADDFGCGDQRISCCPGQGCNIEEGLPSCQRDGECTPVGGVPGGDAAVLDQGTLDVGGAQPAPDAGDATTGDAVAAGDAAAAGDARTSTAPDASSIGRLGGGSADRQESCNCEVTSSAELPGMALLGLLAAAGALSGRRLRRS